MFTKSENDITFAPTVLATLKSPKTAYQGGSFAFIGFTENVNILPLPLLLEQKEHLRCFFNYTF